jgi:hypothetical protein
MSNEQLTMTNEQYSMSQWPVARRRMNQSIGEPQQDDPCNAK